MHSKFVSLEPNWYSTANSFEVLALKSSLLKAIQSHHYFRPTSIQAQAILSLLKAKDTIAKAWSGAGKTTAIAISVLQMIDEEMSHCQAIVLTPTNETSQQIYKKILDLSDKMNISTAICPVQIESQKTSEDLVNSVHILVGTADNITNALKKGRIKTDFVKLLILEEANQITETKEIRGLFELFRKENKDTQLALFTTELTQEIQELTQEFMEYPAIIHERNSELTLEGIKQYYIFIDKEEWKFETLLEVFDNITIYQCVIFCHKNRTAEDLSNKMREMNFTVSTLHSNLDSQECETSLREFRTGVTRILIMTDAFHRRVDCTYLSINYELPLAIENYIHRIGRSGAFGRKGVSISFVTPQDVETLRRIERFFCTQIDDLPLDVTIVFN